MLDILIEAIHPDLQEILDTSEQRELKHNFMSQKRHLERNNIYTGVGKQIGEGSSRTVHEIEPKTIKIDGKHVSIPTVLKIAHKSEVDRNDHELAGVMQNRTEANSETIKKFSVLTPTDDGFKTNPDGVFAPVLSHSSNHHYLKMGKVTPFNHDDFEHHTTTENYPHGIPFYGMMRVVDSETTGYNSYARDAMGHDLYDHILHHPYTQNVIKALKHSKITDIHQGNIGIWEHPITKERKPVILDYGMDYDTEGHYIKYAMSRK